MQCAHPDLLADARAFCERQSLAPTRFGHEAVGDPNLMRDLEAGRELRRKTVAKVRAFMVAREPAATDAQSAA